MYERKSAPAPPYSSGTQTPISPSSAERGRAAPAESRASRSHAAACGSISASANSRASAWISRCSGRQLEVHGGQTIRMRLVAILLAVAVLTACGGHKTASPSEVVRAWSAALDRNDNDAAGGLFADSAQVIQDGEP